MPRLFMSSTLMVLGGFTIVVSRTLMMLTADVWFWAPLCCIATQNLRKRMIMILYEMNAA
jgi:hypothetical protein